MQRQLSSPTRSLVSTPVIWDPPLALVPRSAGFGFQTPLFLSVMHRGHPMWCLPQLSHMSHPGLLVDRLSVRVHVQPQGLASHAGSQDTMHVTALRLVMLHPSPRRLLAVLSRRVRRSKPSQFTLNMDVCITSQLKTLMMIRMSFLEHSLSIVTQHRFYSILEHLTPSFLKAMLVCTTCHFVICQLNLKSKPQGLDGRPPESAR